MTDERTVTDEIFLGFAHNIFEKDDVIACYAQVTLASIEGTGDELRIRGRMDPLTAEIEQIHIDEHIRVSMAAREISHGFDLDDDVDPAIVAPLIYVWDEWNDNAHRPGCEHQTRLGWRADDEGHFREKVGEPCPFCGHPFRTDPQYEPLPYDVVDFVETKLLGAVGPDDITITTLEGEARPLSQIRKTILRKSDAKIAAVKRALIDGQDYIVETTGGGIEHRRLTMAGLRKLAEAGDVSATARLDEIAAASRFGWHAGDVEVVENPEEERKA